MNSRCLFVVTCFIISSIPKGGSEVILFNSPRLKYTDFRYITPPWGPWMYCRQGFFAKGVAIKVETDAGSDDTAINSICLYCGSPGGKIDFFNRICSSEGQYGKETVSFCKFLLVGFQVAQDYTFKEDKSRYGITSIKFTCSDQGAQEVTSNKDFPYGESQRCLSGQAICGIRTQVDNLGKNKGDEAGLLNVEMKCCDLPSPTHLDGFCEAKDSWLFVNVCDNLRDEDPTRCSYKQSTGTRMERMSRQPMEERKAHEAMMSAQLPHKSRERIHQMDFAAALAHSKEPKTGYDWTLESPDTFTKFTLKDVYYDLPPRTRAVIYQVVGQCGAYDINSSKFVRVDTKDDVIPPPPTMSLPGGFLCDSDSSVSQRNVRDPYIDPYPST